MTRARSVRAVVLLSLFITIIYIPTNRAQTLTDTVAKDTPGRISAQLKHFQVEPEQPQNQGKRNKDIERNRDVAETLRHQSIFAPLFRNNSETEALLDTLFENVTRTCTEQLGYALRSLLAEPEPWVLQMFDAFGKFPNGILSGHQSDYGDFYECVNLRGEYAQKNSSIKEVVKGRYCYTYFRLASSGETLLSLDQGKTVDILLSQWPKNYNSVSNIGAPGIGTCFPASCSAEDVQQFLDSFHRILMMGHSTQTVQASYTDEKPAFDAADYVMIVILVLIGGLCLAGTLLDTQGKMISKGYLVINSIFVQILLAFSVYSNSKKWGSTRSHSYNLDCLHGLRFLSMAWVVLCHTYMLSVTTPIWNGLDLGTVFTDYTFAPILNGFMSVDTFFTLSGTLVAYGLLRELDRTKGRFNYGSFVIHRYLRLTPTYALIIGFMATLVPYLGNGPLWYSMELDSEGCRKHWWHNILYVNNFFKYENTQACYSEGWYLAIDMQLYILSPLVIYPLWRWRRVGLGLLGALGVLSMIIPAVITAQKELPPTMVITLPQKTFLYDVYKKPWTRFGPYTVGIGLGYLLHHRAESNGKFPAIPKIAVAAGWLASTALALAIIFVAMPYFDPENTVSIFTAWHAALYAGLHRTLWGLIISWIIFACVNGYGGWVNQLLSLKVFMPLGRLTFCMYITSYHIQMIYHNSVPHAEHYSTYHVVNLFFAHLVMSALISYILTVSLEAPFIQLEKIILSRKQKQGRTAEQSSGLVKGENGIDKNGNSVCIKIENVIR